jgi:hypothetical protein
MHFIYENSQVQSAEEQSAYLKLVAELAGRKIEPPLPPPVISLLRSSSLCFLATTAPGQETTAE